MRAIAVVSVILYHAQIVLFSRDWFEGGFICVGIFFVISGYLITRIILFELQSKGSFSFMNFYERRARRILPMLFVVIFISTFLRGKIFYFQTLLNTQKAFSVDYTNLATRLIILLCQQIWVNFKRQSVER